MIKRITRRLALNSKKVTPPAFLLASNTKLQNARLLNCQFFHRTAARSPPTNRGLAWLEITAIIILALRALLNSRTLHFCSSFMALKRGLLCAGVPLSKHLTTPLVFIHIFTEEGKGPVAERSSRFIAGAPASFRNAKIAASFCFRRKNRSCQPH